MKNIFVLVSLLMLGTVSFVMADSGTGSPDNGAWFMQINGDTSFPTANLANQVNQGWGGEGSVGYRFPANLELSLESGYDTYSAKNGAFNGMWNVIPVVMKLEYGFGDSPTKPYLFVGAGLAFNNKSASFFGGTVSTSETWAGLGVIFVLYQTCVMISPPLAEEKSTPTARAAE